MLVHASKDVLVSFFRGRWGDEGATLPESLHGNIVIDPDVVEA